MACLGVLFSIDEKIVEKIKSIQTDEARLEFLQEEIEEVYFEDFPDRVAELDKSWDAIHRSLTDGKLEWKNGEFPLSHVILGGELLYFKDDYIMTLKTPQQVDEIARAIEKIDREEFRIKYFKIDSEVYGFPLTEEDFEYTFDWLESSKTFWRKAAAEKRYVLFTADQ